MWALYLLQCQSLWGQVAQVQLVLLLPTEMLATLEAALHLALTVWPMAVLVDWVAQQVLKQVLLVALSLVWVMVLQVQLAVHPRQLMVELEEIA